MSTNRKLEELNKELLLAEQDLVACKKATYSARKEVVKAETLLFESNERKLAIIEKMQVAKNGVEAIDDNRASHIAHLKENLPRLMKKIADEPVIEKVRVGDLDTNN